MSLTNSNLEQVKSEIQGKNIGEITSIIKTYYPEVIVMVQLKFDYHCEEPTLVNMLEENAIRINKTNKGFYFSYAERNILKDALIDETIPYVFVTTIDGETKMCELVLEYCNDGMPKKELISTIVNYKIKNAM